MLEYTIHDPSGIQAVILPQKGATVISLTKNGEEFLYRDEDNLRSTERPRCGIPFLFPIFGRLKDETYHWNHQTFQMPIHGFAHTSPWMVAEHTANSLKLLLEADCRTLAQYPFHFRVTLTFTVAEGTLTIHQKYENLGSEPMPYNYGFHPYFLTEHSEDLETQIHADTLIDFASGPQPFGGEAIRLHVPENAPEAGTCLLGVHSPTLIRHPSKSTRLTMTFDESFHTHVLWTQSGKHFLCVEPVNGGADSFNNGTYMLLNPGETKEAFLSLHPETNVDASI